MTEARDRLLKDIHNESEAYYSVEHSGSGVSFYEYLATRLISLGYVSPEEIERQEQRWVESEKINNREAAFEEQRLHDEVEYWKGKNYQLGQLSRE